MTKAKRMMQENVKLIDLIIELVDARIPLSSRNPDIDELGRNKSRIVLLNKSDLVEYDIPEDDTTVKISAKSGEGIERMLSLIAKNLPESSRRMKLLIPYDKAGLGAEIRSSGGKVFGEEYSEKGILTDALVDITLIKKLEEYEIK